jgi:hypothetical protein
MVLASSVSGMSETLKIIESYNGQFRIKTNCKRSRVVALNARGELDLSYEGQCILPQPKSAVVRLLGVYFNGAGSLRQLEMSALEKIRNACSLMRQKCM